MEGRLLVQAARHVEAEDAAPGARGGRRVVAREERDDGEALHGLAEVLPDHRGQSACLRAEGHRDALDLLEVRELDLVQLHHVHGESDGACEGDGGVVVRRVDLLQVALRDEVAHRGPAVAA